MNKIIITLVVFAALFSIAVGQASSTPQATLKLGYVPDADFGCGCYIFRNKSDDRNRRYIFVGPMDEPGYINLNGKTIRLRDVGSNWMNRKQRIGDQFWETYAGDGVKVRIDYTVTRVCAPNDENCESADYRTRLTVTRGNQKAVVKALGVCGC